MRKATQGLAEINLTLCFAWRWTSRPWQSRQYMPIVRTMSEGLALGTKRLRAVQIAVGLLLLFVFYSVGKRFVLDVPHLAAGTMPEEEFDRRYVEQAWLAYLHIVPVWFTCSWHRSSSPTGSAAATTLPSTARSGACHCGHDQRRLRVDLRRSVSFGGLPEASAAVVACGS